MVTLEIVAGTWNEAAKQALSATCRASLYGMLDLAAQIQRGAKLFEVRTGGTPVGWFVLDVAERENGLEGVVIAAAGNLKDVHLTQTILPDIERRFKQMGCKLMRFQTHRRGLVRVMARLGFASTHVTMKKALV